MKAAVRRTQKTASLPFALKVWRSLKDRALVSPLFGDWTTLSLSLGRDLPGNALPELRARLGQIT